MLHLVLYILLAIIVAVGLFLVASRFLPAGEQIAPAIRDEPVWELPAERSLQAADVDTVRLPVALRGYRFAETDVLLDRLAGELRARDAEIDRLRGAQRPAEPPGRAHEPGRTAEPGESAESFQAVPAAVEPTEPVDGNAADHVPYAPPRPGRAAAQPDSDRTHGDPTHGDATHGDATHGDASHGDPTHDDHP